MVMRWKDLNVVHQIDDIILVGEAHENSTSQDLVARIIEDIEVDAFAVESACSSIFLISETGGMEVAREYAIDLELPLIYLDRPNKWICDNITNKKEVVEVANSPQSEINSIGDFHIESILKARRNVRDQFGYNAFEKLFIEREKVMAKRLLGTREKVDGQVLAVTGAFHVLAIKKFLNLFDNGELPDKRWTKPKRGTDKWVSEDKKRSILPIM